MSGRTLVIGGGVGGMVAALRARRHGASVRLVEARAQLGGLASPLVAGGTSFDGGPYILLDRHRLRWALDRVGVDLDDLELAQLDPAYTVQLADRRSVSIHTDLDRTADGLNRVRPTAGDRYRAFVGRATAGLDRLSPLLTEPHSVRRFVASGAWRAAPWTLASLDQLLRLHRLIGPGATATTIWTLIAGGDPTRAPGPMALVPALIHRDGAVRPVGGVHRIVALLEAALVTAGVEIIRNAPVAAITTAGHRVRGVRLVTGEELPAEVVISDVGGTTTLLDLVDVPPPARLRFRLRGVLQSPGLTAYVRLRGPRPSEIRFLVDGDPPRARAVIHPAEADTDGWSAGRLIAPLGAEEAARLGSEGQRALLDEYLSERWWRDPTGSDEVEVEVAATRLVADWGRTFRLRDDAMNLTMTRRQMLLGRLPHRIDHLVGLYLTGSWTHPGQWISFCAVSGVLAADLAHDDHARTGV